MATDKKHIAVYLDKAVEDALTEFCTTNGLEGKKGPMYSAAVNKALAQYFQLGNLTPSNIPDIAPGSIPDNIPGNTASNIPGNIPDSWKQYVAEQLAEAKEEILGKSAA